MQQIKNPTPQLDSPAVIIARTIRSASVACAPLWDRRYPVAEPGNPSALCGGPVRNSDSANEAANRVAKLRAASQMDLRLNGATSNRTANYAVIGGNSAVEREQ